jgi:hypothetical protein
MSDVTMKTAIPFVCWEPTSCPTAALPPLLVLLLIAGQSRALLHAARGPRSGAAEHDII